MNRLVLLHAQLEAALRELLAHPGRSLTWHLGVCSRADGVDLLGPALRQEAPSVGAFPEVGGRLLLSLDEEPEAALARWVARAGATGHWQVRLALGAGTARGHLASALLTPTGEGRPLHHLLLVGPGMHRLGMADPGAGVADAERERWSRTMAALGGEAVWRRLVGLRVAIVGCGRTGSLLAQALAATGVRHLALVDPDHLERHNLGEMAGVAEADLERPKAEALACRLREAYPWVRLEPLVASVTARRSLVSLLACDLLCCCADRDIARLATGILATLYLKPLLDIGTGVLLPRPGSGLAMGADVRLILPGEGCLLCQGGVADPGEARRSLAAVWAEAAGRGGDWRRERAGSLRSLNQVAVGLALRLWEDLVAERRRESTWLRLTFEGGRPSLQEMPRRPEPNCPLCRYLGGGDALRGLVVGSLLAEGGWDAP